MLNASGSTLYDPDQTVTEATEDLDSSGELGVSLKSPKSTGNMAQPVEYAFTFEELVSRLLTQPMSKTDTKFQAVFLCLYRFFSPPSQLLDSIVERFEAIGREGSAQLLMVNAQQRHLAMINEWISIYPGDFAHPFTRHKIQSFIARLAATRIFAVAARELAANLEYATEDDDTDWACSDRGKTVSAKTTQISGKGVAAMAVAVDTNLPPHYHFQHSTTSPLTSPISMSSQMSSTQTLLSLVDQATKQALTFTHTSKYPLTKVHWRQFMVAPDDAVAKELTRMDWIMFMSIRPRDLMRHVTMAESSKTSHEDGAISVLPNGPASVHLENVQRIIDHFNHLATWAANLVLFRDKPKHRSLMLEKLMKIARELRKLNNYNALGALIAGINSSSVQRLHATKELIDPAVGRDFMKLEILMSPQRSHAAYRLAWENSSGERIPYLPLHRRDISAAEQGNKTFVGDETDGADGKAPKKINWKKFEIMGEVVVGIQRAKETPYAALPKNEEVSRLLLDLAIEKDEDVSSLLGVARS
jgi:RasGEF domain/RasGEF N-terminal motif